MIVSTIFHRTGGDDMQEFLSVCRKSGEQCVVSISDDHKGIANGLIADCNKQKDGCLKDCLYYLTQQYLDAIDNGTIV